MTTVPPQARESRGRRWVAATCSTRGAERPVDVALAVARVALAWVFVYYGAGKLFGWWGGPGIHQTSLFMANTAGLHPGGLFAVAGGVIELVGGIAIATGLGTRLAGVVLCADMVIAMITVTWTNGINSEKVPPGYELNLTLAALALVLALSGAGRFSLDALAERRIGSSDPKHGLGRSDR
ncbi:MAG: DoxX [Ilumatobacteraceae bacterium]|nr:DoxX [Ilumatobacteraceae bacterium]